MDDLQAEEDKVAQLEKLQIKLQNQIDDLDNVVMREKQSKADLEKAKRKVWFVYMHVIFELQKI